MGDSKTQTEIQRDRETERQRYRETEIQRDRNTDRQRDKQTGRQIKREIDIWTDTLGNRKKFIKFQIFTFEKFS